MHFVLRSYWLFASLTVALIASANVTAAPIGYYHPSTGSLYLKNDTGYSLPAMIVTSSTSSLKTDKNLYATIPGTEFGYDDLPLGFYYLHFPANSNSPFGTLIGQVVIPHTPTSDLRGTYDVNITQPTMPTFPIIEIPEPSSLALTAMGATLLLRRRQRRQPN